MRKLIIALVVCLLSCAPAFAEPPALALALFQGSGTTIIVGPTTALAWDLDVPQATAATFIHSASTDGGAFNTMNSVTCSVLTTTTATCAAPISQFPMGSHSVVVRVATSDGLTTSGGSAPFAYVVMLIPIPKNIRIK